MTPPFLRGGLRRCAGFLGNADSEPNRHGGLGDLAGSVKLAQEPFDLFLELENNRQDDENHQGCGYFICDSVVSPASLVFPLGKGSMAKHQPVVKQRQADNREPLCVEPERGPIDNSRRQSQTQPGQPGDEARRSHDISQKPIFHDLEYPVQSALWWCLFDMIDKEARQIEQSSHPTDKADNMDGLNPAIMGNQKIIHIKYL